LVGVQILDAIIFLVELELQELLDVEHGHEPLFFFNSECTQVTTVI
jgi:hypothetical protein